jgi:hypothetical protein
MSRQICVNTLQERKTVDNAGRVITFVISFVRVST